MSELFSKLSHRYAALGVGVFALLMFCALGISLLLVQQRTSDLRDRLVNSFENRHADFVITALKNDSRYMSKRLFTPLYNFDISSLNEEVARIVDWLEPDQMLILDRDGHIITDGVARNSRYGQQFDISNFNHELDLQVNPINSGHQLIFSIKANGWLSGFAVIEISNKRDQSLIDEINQEAEKQLQGFYSFYLWMAGLGLLVVTLIGGMIAWRLTRTLSNPIQEMIKAAEEYASGHLDYRLPEGVKYEGEVARLSESLQSMAYQLHTAEKRILQQAHFDNLTGLPNRFLSLDRMQQILNEARRGGDKVALLFLDLDDFKKVNDSLGHLEGDNLLKEAGKRLQSAVRQTDVVGRLGGDEFLVIIGGIDEPMDIQAVIEGLLAKFREPFLTLKQQPMMVTISIGVAIYPDDSNTSTGLLRNADMAMYHAKKDGRNTFSYFTEEMNKKVSRRLQIESALYHALDNDECYVLYQPQYCLESNTIKGVEALIRWDSATMGMIPPDEFIPVAESSGLIHRISRFVMEQSFAQLAQWRKIDDEFSLAINLSPSQFDKAGLVEEITACIKHNELSTKGIELEITEGLLIRSHENTVTTLNELNDLGFSLSIDDFGTGYSSLVYLRTYPFDIVKIDRSFVRDICDDPGDHALIMAMIAMANALDLMTIAEGIETTEQFDALKELGCDLGQGFLMSKPVTAEEINALLARAQ